jgi:hypothetical protein
VPLKSKFSVARIDWWIKRNTAVGCVEMSEEQCICISRYYVLCTFILDLYTALLINSNKLFHFLKYGGIAYSSACSIWENMLH